MYGATDKALASHWQGQKPFKNVRRRPSWAMVGGHKEAGSEPTAKTAQKWANVSRRPSVARRGRSRSARESPD
jgi:hypothetical protein